MATRAQSQGVGIVDNNEGIIMNFADSRIPTMRKVTGRKFVPFGDERNDYPEYLLHLYNKAPLHNAIITGKVMYILGNGLTANAMANESQTFEDLALFIQTDITLFGGVYLERIPKNNGAGYNTYHIAYDRMRTNDDNTKFFYKKDWQRQYLDKDCEREYDAYYVGATDATIFYYKEFRADKKPYALPDYVASCNDIESSIETSKHTLTNAKTGFNASKLITFYMSDKDEMAKRAISRKMKNAYSGAEGEKHMLAFVQDPTKKPTVEDLGASDLTKENITPIQSLIMQNILTGHGVTHGLLFGIQQEGKLGGATELKTAYDIFKVNYINRKRKALSNILTKLAGMPIDIVDSDPIGVQFSEATITAVAPKGWILEQLGIDASKYGEPLPDATTQAQAANTTLTNLSGRQMQGITRIVRQFSQGRLTKAQAAIMLKNGFGFTDDDVNDYLGIDEDPTTDDAKFSQQYNEVDVAEMFALCGEDGGGYIVMGSQWVKGDSEDEMAFAFATVSEIEALQTNISKILKDKPNATNEEIATSLSVTVPTVITVIDKLKNEGLLTVGNGGIRKVLTPNEKKTLGDIKIMYSYEKRPEVGGSELLETSRPFCVKMIELKNQGRMYSRQDIQKISERLGYSVFNRSGGFWNNNGKTESKCRHEFKRNIVIKRNGN